MINNILPLLNHLIENNFNEILDRSILNCHVKGLHSIMLLESPGKTIRMYIAMPGNEMHRNYPNRIADTSMSLGFHGHHCNLTLHCLKGQFINWTVTPGETYDSMCLDKYIYQSKINTGDIAFKSIGKQWLKTKNIQELNEGESVRMMANEIHTVACSSQFVTAWIVYEGQEDPLYESWLWSNCDPNTADLSGFYLKPTKSELMALLKTVFI